MIVSWIKLIPLRLSFYALIAVSALLMMMSARKAGKCAEQAKQLQHQLKGIHAQIHAQHHTPRTRTGLSEWLRKGKL
jgi:hypothetical protein